MSAGTMTSDADCARAGWVEYIASGVEHDLHVSVPPDADLDEQMRVFCHDEQEMLTLNGWLFVFDRVA